VSRIDRTLFTADEIQGLLAHEEGQFLEFKSLWDREQPGLHPLDRRRVRDLIAEYVAAFANADGGTLVLGVDDDEHNVTGHGYPDDAVAEFFAVPTRRLRPAVECTHQRINIDGQEVLVLQVGIAPEAVMVEANGFPYRVGDRVVREPQQVINTRKEAYRRVGFERQIRADATLADVDLELAQRFLQRTVLRDRPIETLLERYGLIAPSAGLPGITNACLLLFCKDPLARWHPRAGVRLFRVSGRERTHGTKRNVNQIGRVEGPLAAAIESTYKLAKEQIRQSEKLHDLFFKEVPEYPEFAWQEAIVNAFAHRDYQDQAREIEVWFYDDRMEVTNPGELIPPITVDLLVLADAGLMREEGEGIPRMFDEMEASLLRLPELAVEAGQFTVLLRNDPIFEGPSSEWQRVIESLGLPVPQKRILLAHPDGFTNEDFRRLNGVDRDAAYRTIQEMIAGGLVMSPDSAGRGATYKVNPDLVAARDFLAARIPGLVRHVRLHGHITNAEYRNLFGVNRDIAFRELKRLVQNGFLQPEGQRRGARYVVGPALPERSGE
jgi:ATP-dependent DNA helicase RecG